MLENGTEPTIGGLTAAEFHCIAYGWCDALDGKPITQETFAADIALYPPGEQQKLQTRYHYYRFAGCTVGYVKSHWRDIALIAGAIAGTGYFSLRGGA